MAKAVVPDADGGVTVYFEGEGRIGLTITNDLDCVASICFKGNRDGVWPVRPDDNGLDEFLDRAIA
jgi:hypothetical protein